MNCLHCNNILEIEFHSTNSWVWHVTGFDSKEFIISDTLPEEQNSSCFRCRTCGAEFNREQAMKLLETKGMIND
jgi:hypothetical protein